MARKKVKLAYIVNDSARKATYKKRKKGLLKKLSELTTLCGIQACAIVFSPYDSPPELWPSVLGVQRVLSQFKNMPEMEQSKKMVNQDTFLRQRIAKAEEQLKKIRKENREKEVTRLMFQVLTGPEWLQGLTMVDLNDISWVIDETLKGISKRIDSFKRPPPPPPPQTAAWVMEVVSPEDGMEFVGDDMGLSFEDHSYNSENVIWSNAFFS
ncbi:agamous-like MADS-box protein AGL80 [Cucurbita moschata]|uniref:Agamous-like MADS-box protein AGL80 n=1 Tax=Cucurbita moschata TaxID=3662 RepID=A0A6J1EUE0_CUCMO|nr:agamous-like MADS-box protein AGL80 [Cucurbita moschata]